jgi:hypothetical protein
LKTACDLIFGGPALHWIPSSIGPMPLNITAETKDHIHCADLAFDRQPGAEMEEFMGWSPTRIGTDNVATMLRPEFY